MDVDGDYLRRPLPAAYMPRRAVGDRQQAIEQRWVEIASITTPLLPEAIANSESFVEHSPSTVIALNVSRADSTSATIAGARGCHLRIGGNEPEHRRHVRFDHAGALGHRADRKEPRGVVTRTACSFGTDPSS